MTRQTRHKALRAGIASLLPPDRADPPIVSAGGASAPLDQDNLDRLPPLLTPKELALILKVTPATVRRRMREGRQPTVEVLGISRITTESAVEQVRARIVRRLPGRYRVPPANTDREADAVPADVKNSRDTLASE